MKKGILILCIFFALGLPGALSYAQDIHFSQYYDLAIFRNPALTGIFSGDYKYGVDYRVQWTNLQVPFSTSVATAETRININEVGDCLSLGLAASFDHAGSIDFNSIQLYPAINYSKSLNDAHRSYLSLGFAGGYIERYIDISKMTFSSQYQNGSFSNTNPSNEKIGTNRIQNYDLSAGSSFNSSIGRDNQVNYYLGIAAYHLTTPKQNFDGQGAVINLNTKLSCNLGFKYKINDQYALTLHADYMMQAPYQELIFGSLLSWNAKDILNNKSVKIYLGLFCRYGDALIPTFKFDYRKSSLTFSYDIPVSSVSRITTNFGGYEISIFFRGDRPKKYKAFSCPRFESISGNSGEY